MLGTFFVHSNNMNWHFMLGIFDISGINSFVVIMISAQVNLCQKHLFLHQLTHNMTKDCSLIYQFCTCDVLYLIGTVIPWCALVCLDLL